MNISEQEYLRADRKSSHNTEYWAERITNVAPASFRHALLSVRVLMSCSEQLREPHTALLGTSARVHVDAERVFLRPAVVLAERPPNGPIDVITAPHAVFEVVSAMTVERARGTLRAVCARLSSLEHFLLIMEHEVRVEHYQRIDGGRWDASSLNCGDLVFIESLGIRFSVNDLYVWK